MSGVTAWYLPITVGIVLIQWWGPRVLVGLFLNACISAGFWGFSRWWLWPVYALPETISVLLSWLLFTKWMRGRYWLPSQQDLLKFAFFGVVLPLCAGMLLSTIQRYLLEDLPLSRVVSAGTNFFFGNTAAGFSLSIFLILTLSSRLQRLNLLINGKNIPPIISPTFIPKSRRLWLALVEIGAIFASICAFWYFIPFEPFLFVSGISIIFAAVQYGGLFASITTILIAFLTLFLPTLVSGASDSSTLNMDEINSHLTLLSLIGLFVGQTITDLKTEASARQSAETAHMKTQALLQAALQQSPAGIIIADAPNMRIRFANAAALNIRGKTDKPLSNIEIQQHAERWQTSRPDGTPCRPEELPLSRAILKGELIHGQEGIIRRESGEERWVSASAAPIFDADGRITAGIVVFSDITDQKILDRKLRENEQNYRNFIKTSLEGIYDYKIDPPLSRELPVEEKIEWFYEHATVEICNEIFAQTYGFSDPKLLVGKRLVEIVGGNVDFAKSIIADFAKLGESFLNVETFIQDENGDEKWYLHNAVCQFESEKIVRIWGSQIDITKRKNAEEELKNYKAHLEEIIDARTDTLRKFSRVVEQNPGAIVITDKKGTIEYVNPAFTDISGYSEAEAEGENLRILKSQHMPARVFEDLWSTITAGNVWRGEMFDQKKSGDHWWSMMSISPIRNPQGEISHFLWIQEDISEKKKLHDDLVFAKERAESSARTKTAFISNMSHEIRTPMNSIMGFIELVLQSGDISSKDRDHLQTAYRSAKNLFTLLNDILEVSKLDEGKAVLNQQPIAIPGFLFHTLAAIPNRGKEKQIRLIIEVDNTLDDCFSTDKQRLSQILTNLVDNALKFTDEGKIVVRAELLPNHFIQFSIEDTGIGMKADALDRIFNPFTQADESSKRRHGGTGLGTTLSRQVTQLLGGRIWVESTPGQGTTFFFTIPANIPECRESCHSECITLLSLSLPQELDISHYSPLNILLAEDITENAEYVRLLLCHKGYRVAVVENGESAVKAYKEKSYDVVLMDIEMPVMDGIQATSMIRELETDAGTHIPIIALTGSVTDEVRESYLSKGFDGVLSKPFRSNALMEKMSVLLPPNTRKQFMRFEVPLDQPKPALFSFQIESIDIIKGLDAWKDKTAYTQALIGFAEKFNNAAFEIESLISDGDFEGAKFTNHALKGVAGNLFIYKVASLSGRIETAIAAKDKAALNENLDALKTQLREVTDEIREAIPRTEQSSSIPAPLDLKETNAQLETLISFLTRGELEENLIQELLGGLSGHVPQKPLNHLRASLDNFDFEEAVTTLRSLSNVLNEKQTNDMR